MNLKQSIKSIVAKYVPAKYIYGVRENILNECKYQVNNFIDKKWYSFAMNLIKHRPLRIGIETTNICSANCIFCAYQYQERKKMIIDTHLFKKIILDYVAIGGGPIEITPIVGEIFIDKNILNHIHFAASFPEIHSISFFTNAMVIDDFDPKEILTCGVSEIFISTTGFDREMYHRIYRSNQYHKVFTNIEKLLRVNDSLPKPIPITLCIRGDAPIQKMEEFPDYKRLLQYTFKMQYTYFYDDWGGIVTEKDLMQEMKLIPSLTKNGLCKQFSFYPKVLVDGSVTLCGCRDFNGASELIIGNIQNHTLYDIWHFKKVSELWERFEEKKYPQICEECNQYRSNKYFIYSKSGRDLILDTNKRFINSAVNKQMYSTTQ